MKSRSSSRRRSGWSPQQLADGTRPECASDHGGRLQPCLLGRLEQVDARGENRLHGVRNDEVAEARDIHPRSVARAPLVDQRPDQLLDEERIALRPLDDDARERTPAARPESARRACGPRRRGQGLQHRASRVAGSPAPGGCAGRTRAARCQQQQRAAASRKAAFEQAEEGGLRPVQVLDQHDGGLLATSSSRKPTHAWRSRSRAASG